MVLTRNTYLVDDGGLRGRDIQRHHLSDNVRLRLRRGGRGARRHIQRDRPRLSDRARDKHGRAGTRGSHCRRLRVRTQASAEADSVVLAVTEWTSMLPERMIPSFDTGQKGSTQHRCDDDGGCYHGYDSDYACRCEGGLCFVSMSEIVRKGDQTLTVATVVVVVVAVLRRVCSTCQLQGK